MGSAALISKYIEQKKKKTQNKQQQPFFLRGDLTAISRDRAIKIRDGGLWATSPHNYTQLALCTVTIELS